MSSNLIDRFLKLMNDRGASDLHLSVGRPPIFRISGRLEPIRFRVLTDEDFERLMRPTAPERIWQQYLEEGDADYAYEVFSLARFRVNVFRQHRGRGAVFRIIPTRIMTIEQLRLPPSVHKLTRLKHGLVLVTGPTGSGKSTTLAALIHEMNQQRAMHFVTIEDPIEFVHENRQALVSQREIGPHSRSFAAALRAAVREDPDCILVGEMRDLETIEMALSAAETGLLVFGTLHTNSAAKTVDRIINVFPSDKQDGVRLALSSAIKGILAQQLLPRKGGGRVAAVEVMFGAASLSSLVREGKSHQLANFISQGRSKGMVGMDDSLRRLVEEDLVEPMAALEKALDKEEMRRWLAERGVKITDEGGG
ncbi:MAG: type IV pilus twitching motility protein PilT [Pseudomonadota bacterium]